MLSVTECLESHARDFSNDIHEISLDSSDDGILSEEDVDGDWAISDSSSGPDIEQHAQAVTQGAAYSQLRNNSVPIGSTDSQLSSWFSSIRFTITCLYLMPVRQVAPITRLREFNRGFFGDGSLYQHFDTLHVQDLYPLASNQIQERLGHLITRRRDLLHYRQIHNIELQRESLESSAAQSGVAVGRPLSTSAENVGTQSSSEQFRGAAGGSIIQPSIKATTFDPRRTPHLLPDLFAPRALSEEDASSIATTRTGRDALPLPHRPKNSRGEEVEDFECPYCGLAVHVKLSAHSWK